MGLFVTRIISSKTEVNTSKISSMIRRSPIVKNALRLPENRLFNPPASITPLQEILFYQLKIKAL